MDFARTADELALRDTLERLAADELATAASLRDCPRTGKSAHLFGLVAGRDYGGGGLNHGSVCVALEALAGGGALPALCLELALHLGCTFAIEQWGSDQHRQAWLARLVRGAATGALRRGADAQAIVLAIGDAELPAERLPGYAADPDAGRMLLQELISAYDAASRIGLHRRTFSLLHGVARKSSQKHKLAGVPADGEQSLYHAVSNYKVQLDAATLLVDRSAWALDASGRPGNSAALAHVLLRGSVQTAALAALEAIADREMLPADTLIRLQAEVACLPVRVSLVSAPRRLVAQSLLG